MDRNGLRSTDGRRWAFFSRLDVEQIENPDETYLTRWRIVQTPWGGLYLHAIRSDDGNRPLHDHPWSFGSLILKGGYVEELEDGSERTWIFGSWHWMRHPSPHAIRLLFRSPTWSLVVTGPRVREWGFLTKTGWVHFKQYIKEERERLGITVSREGSDAGVPHN